MERVEFYLNEELVATLYQAPFTQAIVLPPGNRCELVTQRFHRAERGQAGVGPAAVESDVFVDNRIQELARIAGVPVSLSTDDPPFFGTTLAREYECAHTELGLTKEQLWQINLNGLRHGLADTGTRRRLLREFSEAGRRLGLY